MVRLLLSAAPLAERWGDPPRAGVLLWSFGPIYKHSGAPGPVLATVPSKWLARLRSRVPGCAISRRAIADASSFRATPTSETMPAPSDHPRKCGRSGVPCLMLEGTFLVALNFTLSGKNGADDAPRCRHSTRPAHPLTRSFSSNCQRQMSGYAEVGMEFASRGDRKVEYDSE